MAVASLAEALAASGDVYAADDDPELVGAALPFALKTLESLLAEVPEHRGLLLATCRGFTQYAYAFVAAEAERVEAADYRRAAALEDRALKLYLRARGYGLRLLELDHPGVGSRLQRRPEAAAAELGPPDVAALYWTAAAWGGAVSLGLDRPELVADLPAVRSLIERGLALDGSFDGGALHEAMIALEAVPEAMGGSPARARRHFERAVELSGGLRASPFVAYAGSVAVAQQDRTEFEALLARALAVDPEASPGQRLANLLAQRRARDLLAQADELFLDDGGGGGVEEQ